MFVHSLHGSYLPVRYMHHASSGLQCAPTFTYMSTPVKLNMLCRGLTVAMTPPFVLA